MIIFHEDDWFFYATCLLEVSRRSEESKLELTEGMANRINFYTKSDNQNSLKVSETCDFYFESFFN